MDEILPHGRRSCSGFFVGLESATFSRYCIRSIQCGVAHQFKLCLIPYFEQKLCLIPYFEHSVVWGVLRSPIPVLLSPSLLPSTGRYETILVNNGRGNTCDTCNPTQGILVRLAPGWQHQNRLYGTKGILPIHTSPEFTPECPHRQLFRRQHTIAFLVRVQNSMPMRDCSAYFRLEIFFYFVLQHVPITEPAGVPTRSALSSLSLSEIRSPEGRIITSAGAPARWSSPQLPDRAPPPDLCRTRGTLPEPPGTPPTAPA